jgi:hypothetical protein
MTIREMILRMRVFKRLRDLEATRVSYDFHATVMKAYHEMLTERFVACPHCGSVLDRENPGTSRPFVTKDGERLCCWACRPFMPKPVVRVSHPTQPIRNAKKGKA